MIIDSHAHLFTPGVDKETIVSTLEKEGIERLICIGTNVLDSISAANEAKKEPRIFATVGIHPDYASQTTQEDLEKINELAKQEKVVAIGEIGLDYHTRTDNKEKQKEVFRKQIEIAIKHSLPVCIHSRDARQDTYEILKDYKGRLVDSVMHCYSEDGEYAQKYLDLGFYISFAGNITYKNSDRSYLSDIPLDRILVETDSPFLPPQSKRGQKNEPRFIKYTAEFLADELDLGYEEFNNITMQNTYRVFKRLK